MTAADLWRLLSYSDGRSGRLPFVAGLMLLTPPCLLLVKLGLPLALLLVPMSWFWVCMISKRLHDLGRAGPWLFAAAGLGLATFGIAWAVFLLALALIPGQAGENRFGPAPGRGVT